MSESENELSAVDPCVDPGGEVSFACILSAVSDIRNGNFSVNTIRKLIRQVDNALAITAGDSGSVALAAAPEGISELCDAVEQNCSADSVSATAINPLLASLLLALLKAALEKFGS